MHWQKVAGHIDFFVLISVLLTLLQTQSFRLDLLVLFQSHKNLSDSVNSLGQRISLIAVGLFYPRHDFLG